ncbi:MAG: class I SAM-dependent methyltransferase [Streptosporangiaceae bacterium]|nr:class I SAM-dependent methyltransferase [Streptosporangiaceae bacterium]MBV9854474.1 class I SAM-dependent methyltransferase [Streptosporangiaceae bacterium]
MADEVRFAADLYRGSAGFYDQYRLPYPETMLADLVQRAAVSGHGRLLDMACGTGQLAFPLRRWFPDGVWAVDQEPDMVDVVRAKTAAAGAGEVRPVVSSAESLDARSGSFELAVIGNAFHRLDRDLVARQVFGWLQPGGCLALCWSTSPWAGGRDWQQALAAVMARWRTALGAGNRAPAGWDLARRRRPDAEVLSEAGFEAAGRREFTAVHRWSLPELAGHIRSTSVLPPPVLGDQAAAFDDDLAASLSPHSDDGAFPDTVSFAYDLARKPA